VLLVFGAPRQFPSLAGLEHGRTIPLTDVLALNRPCLHCGADGRVTGPNEKRPSDVRFARWPASDIANVVYSSVAVWADHITRGAFK
jgi:hypothetical protein